ncbi:MAG: hypothetical protein LAO79_04025 [Acidobacteriia bacterium]|nr:hypothetical protein [Terriglobia bacterium]
MKLLSSFILVAAAACAQGLPIALGQNIQTFAMVGLAQGQTARLNVLNPGVPAPLATGIICSALLTFYDDQGASLKSATVAVIPNRSMQLDLESDADLKLAVNQRRQIRATIQIPPSAPPAGSAPSTCTLVPSLEIFDSVTGKTQVVLTDVRPVGGIFAVIRGTLP